jgi:acyl carrier protein
MKATMSADISARIREILLEELGVDSALIHAADADTPLLGRGIGLDSIEAVRLALGLENAFDISIPDGDLTTDLFTSLGTLTAYVESRMQAQLHQAEL